MRLVSFIDANGASWGVLTMAGIVDIGRRGGSPWPTLKAAIAADALGEVARIAAEARPEVDPVRVELDVPVPDAGAILCAGRNYKDHVAEMGHAAVAAQPTYFVRTHVSLCRHGQALVRPKVSTHFDYEGELACVIGRGGRHIRREDALAHIAGYSVFLDGSVRDWQKHSTSAGKNFWRTGGFGPWLVTADEIADPSQLTLETRINGEVRQHVKTDMLIYDIPAIIAYLSDIAPLFPGDVIATGSPSGVAAGMKEPKWLREGDTVEVEISKIGTLVHPVLDEV